MKTVLEIYYLRILGERVRYQCKEVKLSRKVSDPDNLIWPRIRQEPRHSATEEHEFIVHSTSWRYERPGKARSFSLKDLRTAGENSRKPSSPAELEKRVVSHAVRHIAFLVKTDE